MIDDDVEASFSGVNATVTGTVKHITDFTDFGPDEADGHYFPVTLAEAYEGKDVTVISSSKTKTAPEREWILKLDDCRFYTFKVDGETILTLNFYGTTLEE